jgi:hypothetical protein
MHLARPKVSSPADLRFETLDGVRLFFMLGAEF